MRDKIELICKKYGEDCCISGFYSTEKITAVFVPNDVDIRSLRKEIENLGCKLYNASGVEGGTMLEFVKEDEKTSQMKKKHNKARQMQVAYENACDYLVFGYGKKSWLENGGNNELNEKDSNKVWETAKEDMCREDGYVHNNRFGECNFAMKDLEARYDGRQSFYSKARVDDTKKYATLYSYNTKIARYDKETGEYKYYNQSNPLVNSQTTRRHLKEFKLQCENGCDFSIRELIKDAKGESLPHTEEPQYKITTLGDCSTRISMVVSGNSHNWYFDRNGIFDGYNCYGELMNTKSIERNHSYKFNGVCVWTIIDNDKDRLIEYDLDGEKLNLLYDGLAKYNNYTELPESEKEYLRNIYLTDDDDYKYEDDINYDKLSQREYEKYQLKNDVEQVKQFIESNFTMEQCIANIEAKGYTNSNFSIVDDVKSCGNKVENTLSKCEFLFF